MRILPDNYLKLNLSTDTKRCIQSLKNRLPDYFTGIVQVNISGSPGDDHFAIIYPHGLLLLRFLDIEIIQNEIAQKMLYYGHTNTLKILYDRLLSHSNLKNDNGQLLFPIRLIYVFNNVETFSNISQDYKEFFEKECKEKRWLTELRNNAEDEIVNLIECSAIECSMPPYELTLDIIDLIINRIAPWCTIPKLPGNIELESSNGIDAEETELKSTDSIIEVLRLDPEQVDKVNAISQGHQLVLACAGSGKSVILIARCFKLASLDKTKKYLITCYNRNLCDYYNWQIDEAGFKDRNVDCFTFHGLCSRLLKDNKIKLPNMHDRNNEKFEELFLVAKNALAKGQIKDRYYGIFIDEVQIFDPRWYKFCYNLLENPKSENHIFVISGDLTQDIRKNIRKGDAPWQGEGLPAYRGRTIHIEKNYRNCIQINSFINEYADVARRNMSTIDKALDQETYLRGKAFRTGNDPILVKLKELSSKEEARRIFEVIVQMHDKFLIGYTDIAVLLYYKQWKYYREWNGRYQIKNDLEILLRQEEIPYDELSWQSVRKDYQARHGVSLLTYDGALGIDYRGVIVAGTHLVGKHERVDQDDQLTITGKKEEDQHNYISGFNALYLACTRAKECLAIIVPKEEDYSSIYINTLYEAFNRYKEKNIENEVI